MKTRFTIALALLLVTLAVGFASRGFTQDPGPNPRSEFMQAKLVHSQKVLEGLAVEDYAMIAQHSQAMSLLTLESSSRLLQTPEYARHADDFRRAADSLTGMAENKNVDGATLAYFQLTLTCVNCHKYIRSVGAAIPR